MKKRALLVLLTLVCCGVSALLAALLGVKTNLTYPEAAFSTSTSTAVNYTASNGFFSVSAPLQTMAFSSLEGTQPFSGGSTVQISIVVNNTGALAGPTPTDLVLQGTVSRIVGGVTNTYSGVLLTGQVMGFGFSRVLTTASYDFSFTPTGGLLENLFCGDIAVTLTSASSTFTGVFTSNFHGQAKGVVGALDYIPPTIICPTNIVVESQAFAGGLPGAYVSYSTPVVTDNCDPNPTVVCTPPSGSFFALAPSPSNMTNYVVTCVAKDAAGNSNVCAFTITVEDTLPPQFADTNNPVIYDDLTHPILLTNDTGVCYATFTFADPEAVDNAWLTDIQASVSAVDQNGASIALTDLGNGMLQGQFPVTCTGLNVVTVTADDGRGNTTQHQVGILVVDNQPPVINCPTNQVVECTGGQVFFEEPIISDNCPNVTYSCTPTNGSFMGVGPHAIVCTATDCSGNTNQCSFYVTVQDTTPPTISCPSNVTVECGQSIAPSSTGMATASDICDAIPTATFTDAVSGNCPQTITRTWTATDYSGNSNSCVQIITIQDTTAPVIACPPDKQLQCGDSTAPANTGTATATDNCSGNVAITFTDVATPANCTGNAGIDRTWKATDACGNSSTCVQHITFVDTTAPVITSVPAGRNLGCNPASLPTDASVKALVTATDNSGSVTVTVTHVDAGTTTAPTRTFTITATDGCGNVATAGPVVYTWTADTTAPVISSVPAGRNLGCNPASLPTDASVKALVTATDNSGSVTVTVTHVDAGTAIAPTRTFTITATDGCGNVATASPVVYTWTADTTPPVISSVPAGGNLGCNPATLPTDASVKALVTATDNSGSVTVSITHVDGGTACAPTRTFTITATDGCGNASAPQTVVYSWTADTTAPVITSVPAGSNLGCNPTNLPTDASVQALVAATDNCGVPTINVSHVDATSGCTVTRTFTVTATDACGNTSAAQTVVYSWKVDTTAPTFYGCTNQVVYQQVVVTTNKCSIGGGFNYNPIKTNCYVWFNSVLTPCTGITNKTYTVTITGQTITGDIGGTNVSLTVPDATITYSSTTTNCTTTFSNNTWVTTCPLGSTLNGDQFGSGLAYKMPFASSGGGTLAWSGNFATTAGVPVMWKWGACVYTNLSTTYTNLGVKPVDDSTKCSYKNSDAACTPENFKQYLAFGARCGYYGNYCGNRTGPWVCNRGTNTTCSGGVVQYVPPTATDPCSGIPNVVCSPLPGVGFVSGSTNVTCTAVDDCGNVATCTFSVNLVSPPPTITGPGNITTNTTSSSCSQVVKWTVTSSSPCGATTTTCTPASGSTFAKGTTPVTCTAVAAGGTNSCSFTVTVNDTTKPTVTCPANITTNTCASTAVVTFTPTVTDNCPGVTYSCTPASGTAFAQGTNTVTCTATDASGNTASASFKVIVNTDKTKPTITCPANITTNTCASTAVVTFTPTVSDNCSGVTYSCTPASGTAFAQGTNTVTCTATDASGNTASASFKVIVTATAPGTVGCPTATAGTNRVVLTWPAISASAPITYSVSRSLSSGSGYSTIASGITALTYTNTGLTKGTTYYYYVTATNCKGTSSAAYVVSATSK
jgi:hypothetical protein